MKKQLLLLSLLSIFAMTRPSVDELSFEQAIEAIKYLQNLDKVIEGLKSIAEHETIFKDKFFIKIESLDGATSELMDQAEAIENLENKEIDLFRKVLQAFNKPQKYESFPTKYLSTIESIGRHNSKISDLDKTEISRSRSLNKQKAVSEQSDHIDRRWDYLPYYQKQADKE